MTHVETVECLTGPRADEEILVDLLDTRDRLIRPLDGVMGGDLSFSIHNTVRSGGSLQVVDPQRVNWHQHRLGIRYEYTFLHRERNAHPQGVFLPTSPTTDHSEHGPTGTVDLYDKMLLLTRRKLSSTWTVDKGTTVVNAVTQVLDRVNETRISAPDDGGGTISPAMTWGPGEETTLLRVANDTLEAGNFFSLWVDGNGVWRLAPYIPPTGRGVEWEFVEGPAAIFEAEFTHEEDDFEIPNRVIMVGRVDDDDDAPPLVGIAENTDPDDPYSIPSVGEIEHWEQDTDATSEGVLGELAARRLLDLSSVSSTYELAHPYIPLDLNSAVRLQAGTGIDALAVLQSWSWSWTSGEAPGLVSSRLREVAQ